MVGSGAVTVSVTLTMVEPVAPLVPLIVTVPLQVPAPRLPGFTDTLTLPCVVPAAGEAASQPLAQLPAETCALNARPAVPLLTVTGCGEGAVLPAV